MGRASAGGLAGGLAGRARRPGPLPVDLRPRASRPHRLTVAPMSTRLMQRASSAGIRPAVTSSRYARSGHIDRRDYARNGHHAPVVTCAVCAGTGRHASGSVPAGRSIPARCSIRARCSITTACTVPSGIPAARTVPAERSVPPPGRIADGAVVQVVVAGEQWRHPGRDRSVGGTDLRVDGAEERGKASEGQIRALAVLEPRESRLVDPGEILDLALGEAGMDACGTNLGADADHRMVRRALVAFPDGFHAKPLLEEPLVHAAIQAEGTYPAIDRTFTATHRQYRP